MAALSPSRTTDEGSRILANATARALSLTAPGLLKNVQNVLVAIPRQRERLQLVVEVVAQRVRRRKLVRVKFRPRRRV